MKFNHDSKTMTGAFNIQMSTEAMAEQITDIVREWALSAEGEKISLLAESLHNKLPYEVILLLATKEVHGKVISSLSELEGMLSKIISEQAKMN